MDINTMISILDEEVVFYTDAMNDTEVYVEYRCANGAICFEPIKSKKFHAFLGVRYRELTRVLERPDYKELLAIKEEDAIHMQDNQTRIYRRVAGNMNQKIVYFLSDPAWKSVIVTADGWRIGRNKKVKFLRYATDKPQVLPQKGGNYLDLMLPKINMDYDDALLYAIFLIQGLSRSSSHFLGIISSKAGSGKTTLTKQTMELIDPKISSVTLTPTSEEGFKTMLSNTYLATLDNTEPLSTAYSNILCAAITGSAEPRRTLYTTNDLTLLNLHNLILINGIDAIPRKPDLLDRALCFELKTISKKERKTDTEIWGTFNRDKPKILGAMFDALSKAMTILPTLRVAEKERMSDAHREMTAIAIALGIQQEEFQRILDKNRKKLQDAYATHNEFVDFVIAYMSKHAKIDVSVTTLYKNMRENIVGSDKFFPKSPSALSRKLNEEREAILLAGYKFESRKENDANYIKIWRVPKNQQTKAQEQVEHTLADRYLQIMDQDNQDC